ncbi:hypothetical protein BTR22_19730 [Alkalihalophilus pseudofirmus]|uniref:hypothetical protein n=1 Tax=Alkalihalophilus pseudofirmus TaxID=79885 RepID=UPI0009512159|nr:hypothetical protein BTR22_19730 [Alkalihalophilus pseudofirmus]
MARSVQMNIGLSYHLLHITFPSIVLLLMREQLKTFTLQSTERVENGVFLQQKDDLSFQK